MSLLFDCIYFFGSLIYLPILFLKGKWHQGLLLRFGGALKGYDFSKERKMNVWIHAVSVGEVNAVIPLVQKLIKRSNELNVYLTVTTQAGYALAKQKWPQNLMILWAPLDFSFVVKNYVNQLRPDIYIIVETEIWPNLIQMLHLKNIPIVLINGRISIKAFSRYRWVRIFLRKSLERIKYLFVQSKQDASRFQFLGAAPSAISIVGNMKFDQPVTEAKFNRLDVGLSLDALVMVAGSTHPKEEEIILDVYKKLKNEFPLLQLIIAPRHVERSEELLHVIKSMGLDGVFYSQMSKSQSWNGKICVVEKIGLLRSIYQLADIVFVGKSLVLPGGGQNIIEPAFFAKPILVGPLMQNFQDIMVQFLMDKALVQLETTNELFPTLRQLLIDKNLRFDLGQKAQAVVQKHQGATDKTLQMIQGLISG